MPWSIVASPPCASCCCVCSYDCCRALSKCSERRCAEEGVAPGAEPGVAAGCGASGNSSKPERDGMIRCILDSDGTLLCPRFFRSWYSSAYACLAGVAQERNQEIPHPREQRRQGLDRLAPHPRVEEVRDEDLQRQEEEPAQEEAAEAPVEPPLALRDATQSVSVCQDEEVRCAQVGSAAESVFREKANGPGAALVFCCEPSPAAQ